MGTETGIIQFPKQEILPDWETESNIAIIRNQIAPDLNGQEFDLFMAVCRMRNLNPLTRDIFAMVHSKNNPQKRKMTIVTGIDGFSKLANRTGQFAGSDKPVYTEFTKQGYPAICEITVYKMVNGVSCAFTVEARWEEFVATDYDGKVDRMWSKMPHNMLSKCALAKALRLAFPEEIGGLYTSDEMAQANNPPVVVNAAPSIESRSAAPVAVLPAPVKTQPAPAVEQAPSSHFQEQIDPPIEAGLPSAYQEVEIAWPDPVAQDQTVERLEDTQDREDYSKRWTSPGDSQWANRLLGSIDTKASGEDSKVLAWFYSVTKTEYNMDHKAILDLFRVESLKKEFGDWKLGFLLDQIGLLRP